MGAQMLEGNNSQHDTLEYYVLKPDIVEFAENLKIDFKKLLTERKRIKSELDDLIHKLEDKGDLTSEKLLEGTEKQIQKILGLIQKVGKQFNNILPRRASFNSKSLSPPIPGNPRDENQRKEPEKVLEFNAKKKEEDDEDSNSSLEFRQILQELAEKEEKVRRKQEKEYFEKMTQTIRAGLSLARSLLSVVKKRQKDCLEAIELVKGKIKKKKDVIKFLNHIKKILSSDLPDF